MLHNGYARLVQSSVNKVGAEEVNTARTARAIFHNKVCPILFTSNIKLSVSLRPLFLLFLFFAQSTTLRTPAIRSARRHLFRCYDVEPRVPTSRAPTFNTQLARFYFRPVFSYLSFAAPSIHSQTSPIVYRLVSAASCDSPPSFTTCCCGAERP